MIGMNSRSAEAVTRSNEDPCETGHTGSSHQETTVRPPNRQSAVENRKSKMIPVAAGILIRGEEILICQRHRSDPYGLQWEFPGGKVRGDESFRQALARELGEELAIQAEVGPEVFRLQHLYPDRFVEVVFFRVDSFSGEPRNLVSEEILWVRRDELPGYKFLEADLELVQRIAAGEII
jgi:8-oxo-dGTP diphosphatase